ncbi:MAG: Maf family protein [Niabella sp.]
MMERIILASGSPRRKQLLEWAEVPFEIITKDTDETFPEGMDVKSAAVEVALRKALAVQQDVDDGRIILAADTVVVLDGQPIGKPKDKADAVNILTQLQDHTHYVITGVALVKGEEHHCFADVTEVSFHPLTPQQIVYYVERYNPYDKAGAYAIQEWIGVVGIKSINGDFYNVMGLPVSRVVQELRKMGLEGK